MESVYIFIAVAELKTAKFSWGNEENSNKLKTAVLRKLQTIPDLRPLNIMLLLKPQCIQ